MKINFEDAKPMSLNVIISKGLFLSTTMRYKGFYYLLTSGTVV